MKVLWMEAVVFASKEIGLEGNAAKIKYMIMSWDQNAGSHSMKIDNGSFARVEKKKFIPKLSTEQFLV